MNFRFYFEKLYMRRVCMSMSMCVCAIIIQVDIGFLFVIINSIRMSCHTCNIQSKGSKYRTTASNEEWMKKKNTHKEIKANGRTWMHFETVVLVKIPSIKQPPPYLHFIVFVCVCAVSYNYCILLFCRTPRGLSMSVCVCVLCKKPAHFLLM